MNDKSQRRRISQLWFRWNRDDADDYLSSGSSHVVRPLLAITKEMSNGSFRVKSVYFCVLQTQIEFFVRIYSVGWVLVYKPKWSSWKSWRQLLYVWLIITTYTISCYHVPYAVPYLGNVTTEPTLWQLHLIMKTMSCDRELWENLASEVYENNIHVCQIIGELEVKVLQYLKKTKSMTFS